jgi:hypothetical protein
VQRELSVAASRGMSPFGQYQPATKGEIVFVAKATLNKWL